MELDVFPLDQILFEEELCDKVNSKLKRLRVRLTKSTENGSSVFNLDIKGLNKYKFHVNFPFSEQDVCFLQLEEVQDRLQESTCFSCLDRNFYPSIVYSRLLLLLFCVDDQGDAKCIKVPFLQRGNLSSTTCLRKLQYTIYEHITDEVSLRHWPVYVDQCGMMDRGERVYLGITHTALVVVLHHHILHHHTFYNCLIECHTEPRLQTIEITVRDKTCITDNCRTDISDSDDFTQTYVYIFKTTQYEAIEKRIKSVEQEAKVCPSLPPPHYNITHREVSASGFMPGTTSDNFMIMPHLPRMHNNNTSGSTSGSHSASNGHIPNVSNTSAPMVVVHPVPHHPLQTHPSTSSNNWTAGSGSAPFPFDLSPDRKPMAAPRPNILAVGDESFRGRGQMVQNENIQKAASDCKPVIDNKQNDLNSPKAHSPAQVGDSLPNTHDGVLCIPNSPLEGGTVPGFNPEIDIGQPFEDIGFFPDESEIELPPPPTPCSAVSQPHGEIGTRFQNKPTVQFPTDSDETDPKVLNVVAPRNSSNLMRAQSVCHLDFNDHTYVNVMPGVVHRRLLHDDEPYYRFYYNFGFIARMSKRINRRNRLSKEIPTVDFNKIEDHEKWFDVGFKYRGKDQKFCKLKRMKLNIEEPLSPPYARVRDTTQDATKTPDDPYWDSNLPITIQKILQDSKQTFYDIMRAFDLSFEQLTGIQIYLSLLPSQSNWKDLAEYIGLDSQDITIIEHFCYTYRELTTKVVLAHWIKIASEKNTECIPATWDSLRHFLEVIDRQDIMTIIQSETKNNVITHF